MMICLFILMLAGGVALLSCSGGNIDRHTVPHLNPSEILGTWYELGRFDHSFERGLSEVETRYTLDEDGFIRVENNGYDAASGSRRVAIGRAKTTNDPGRLRVSFFWKFYSDYNILERGEQGEWMLIGSHSPRYLWILSRTPTLPAETMEHILKLARQRGYDTNQLILRDKQ